MPSVEAPDNISGNKTNDNENTICQWDEADSPKFAINQYLKNEYEPKSPTLPLNK